MDEINENDDENDHEYYDDDERDESFIIDDDKPVDNDWDGECEDKDRKQGSKASDKLQSNGL